MAFYLTQEELYFFDFESSTWSRMQHDFTEPIGSRYFTLSIEDYILTLGGVTNTTLNRVLVFSREETVKYTKLNPMITCRADLFALFHNNCIFAIGGYNEESMQPLNTVEIYNFSTAKWRPLRPMQYSRHKAAACAVSDVLYVIGGVSSSTIEKLDIFTEQWSLLDLKMPIALSSMGVIILPTQNV